LQAKEICKIKGGELRKCWHPSIMLESCDWIITKSPDAVLFMFKWTGAVNVSPMSNG